MQGGLRRSVRKTGVAPQTGFKSDVLRADGACGYLGGGCHLNRPIRPLVGGAGFRHHQAGNGLRSGQRLRAPDTASEHHGPTGGTDHSASLAPLQSSRSRGVKRTAGDLLRALAGVPAVSGSGTHRDLPPGLSLKKRRRAQTRSAEEGKRLLRADRHGVLHPMIPRCSETRNHIFTPAVTPTECEIPIFAETPEDAFCETLKSN